MSDTPERATTSENLPPVLRLPAQSTSVKGRFAWLKAMHGGYRTLLGLLCTTGIRIGEAFDLNLEHFDRDEQHLYIAEGKFRKSRWVPLSASTGHQLRRYAKNRLRMKLHSPDAPLFLNQRCRRLHHSTVDQTFRRLLKQCGLCDHQEKRPRIHDLRHTFVVHRLLAWYRDGQDVNARLPWLAIRDKALLLLLYNTGARVSEIVELKLTGVRLAIRRGSGVFSRRTRE